jgi:hypothetical protein
MSPSTTSNLPIRETTTRMTVPPPLADLLTYATNQQAMLDNVPPAHQAKMMSEAINRHSKGNNAIRKTYISISHHSKPPTTMQSLALAKRSTPSVKLKPSTTVFMINQHVWVANNRFIQPTDAHQYTHGIALFVLAS